MCVCVCDAVRVCVRAPVRMRGYTTYLEAGI